MSMTVENARKVLERARTEIEFFVLCYLNDKGFTLLLEQLAGDEAGARLLLEAYEDLGVDANFTADQIVEGAHSLALIMNLVWKLPDELLPPQTPTKVVVQAAIVLFHDKARSDYMVDNDA